MPQNSDSDVVATSLELPFDAVHDSVTVAVAVNVEGSVPGSENQST